MHMVNPKYLVRSTKLFAAQDDGDATKHEESAGRRRFGGMPSANLSIFAMTKWRELLLKMAGS